MGRVQTIGQRSGWVRWSVLIGVALWAAACGGSDSSDDARYDVTSEVVSHETTQDILVFAPDAEGSWPVVFALHGLDGEGEHVAEFGRRLAERGFVVFAPTYRTELGTEQGQFDTVRDLVCAGWFASDIAGDHGGDLGLPTTFLGWSFGAGYALEGGLSEELDPEGILSPCSADSIRAEVIVALAGCHYEAQGTQFDFDTTGWSNEDATIVMAVGEDDTQCAPWQSEDAAEQMRAQGYDVDLVVFDDADHFSPLYLAVVDDELVPDLDHPAGERLVDIVDEAVDARIETS